METFIRIDNLHFTYESGENKTKALSGVSLEIEEGSFVAIIGHNGSGKSTLAKMLNGILVPSEGRVFIDGMDTRDEAKLLDIRRCVGMVFQNPDNQLVASIVEEDVAFAPENLGIEPEEIRKRVDEALRQVDMYDYRFHAPHLLSGGQKQRVAIAGVIAMRPRCIVLDEPTAMLDPAGRREVIDTITRLRRENGISVILITHHMIEGIGADKIYVMNDGGIAFSGTPSEVFSKSDGLRELGLTVPDTVLLLSELRNAGLRIPEGALTVQDCAEAIALELKS